jgi:hypothetical protein
MVEMNLTMLGQAIDCWAVVVGGEGAMSKDLPQLSLQVTSSQCAYVTKGTKVHTTNAMPVGPMRLDNMCILPFNVTAE